MCGCFLGAPHWGPSPQPRHMPWLGIEVEALWFTGWSSIHWATPARAKSGKFYEYIWTSALTPLAPNPQLACPMGGLSRSCWELDGLTGVKNIQGVNSDTGPQGSLTAVPGGCVLDVRQVFKQEQAPASVLFLGAIVEDLWAAPSESLCTLLLH